MIFTRMGVAVRVIGKSEPDGDDVELQVQSVDDADWVRWRFPSELVADDGMAEILQAAESAPVVGRSDH